MPEGELFDEAQATAAMFQDLHEVLLHAVHRAVLRMADLTDYFNNTITWRQRRQFHFREEANKRCGPKARRMRQVVELGHAKIAVQ
jgi:hypothetical protein